MKITVTAAGSLFDVLQVRFPETSRTTIRQMLRHDRVTLDGRVVRRADTPVHPGQVIEVGPGRAGVLRPPCEILFRDEHILAVEKPAGLLSIGRDRPGEDTLHRRLNDFVQEASRGRERVYIVHRLDRLASGIMIFAFTPQVQDRLQSAWPSTEKRYWALVEGGPPAEEGTLRGWLRENESHRVYSTAEGPEAKFAITHYRVHRRGAARSVLEVRIETGRKNQIRVHMSDLGCPIVGDRRYGARTNPIHRLGLHACLLAFTHPVTGERIRLELPLPGAFRAA